MDSEIEMQRMGDTDGETGRDCQKQIGPETQRKRQRTETNGLGYTVPLPTQHKG